MKKKLEKKQGKNKATLYLNMILKWDEPPKMVARSIDSVFNQVDGVYITVTHGEEGRKENTPLVKLLKKKYKANVSYFKWIDDFSAARNFAMAQVPQSKDIFIYWQDADDILQGAQYLHDVADMALNFNWAGILFHYWYIVDLDEKGRIRNVVVDHVRERVIRNDGTFKWIGMLHELLIEQKQENIIKVSNEDCTVVHISSTGERMDKNIKRNIRILGKQAMVDPKDPRPIAYLGKAHVDKAQMTENKEEKKSHYNQALKLFYKYLEGAGAPGTEQYQDASGWPQERATVWKYIGEIAIREKNHKAARGAFQNAIDESPEFPDYYVDLALTYTMLNDYKKAKHWLGVSKNIEMPKTTIITTPRDMMTRALEAEFHISLHFMEFEKARKAVQQLLEIYPEQDIQLNRLELLDDVEDANKASQSVVYLGKRLEKLKDKRKLAHLVQAIPDDLRQERFATEMRHMFLPPKKWKDNEIALLCGPGMEEWSPESLKTGIGGSEAAVVYLSQELKKLGWKVTVYANPGAKFGNFNGVKYLQWYDLNPKDNFNILILWRNIGFTDFKPKSKFTMVWLHDVPNNPDFTDERVSAVNKIAPLSKYHGSLLKLFKDGKFEEMPKSKIFLTTNGIPPIKIPKVKRDPYRMTYSSSLDRGLVYLLRMWPDIIKEVPQAKLDIFYGFHVFDKMYADNPGRQKWKAIIMKMMEQPGIAYHGRVGRDELHKAQASSGIWAYPTDFAEISCISAMENQRLGAIPVVTDFAALKETVKNGVRIDVDITTEDGQAEYKKQLVKVLKDHKLQEEIRPEMMKWAEGYFGWDKVAHQWDELFRINIQNPEVAKKKEV